MVRPSGALLAVCLLLAGEALAQSAKYKCSLDPGARNPGLRAVDLEVSAGAGREPWSVRGQFSLSANPVSDQHYYHGSLAITDTPPRSAREIVLKASSAIFMEN